MPDNELKSLSAILLQRINTLVEFGELAILLIDQSHQHEANGLAGNGSISDKMMIILLTA